MSYSVVVPAYNAQDTITECLDSIFSQSVKPEQVIVVNDGSTDNTTDIIQLSSLDITLISQPNAGPGAASTVGFSAAKHPIIATLDADDIWLESKMEKQLDRLESDPSLSGIFGHVQVFRERSNLGKSEPGWGRTTMTFRRDVFLEVGPVVDPDGGCGEMIDWIARGRLAGFKFEMHPDVLALRRIRPGSLTYGRPRSLSTGYLEIARQMILRKRLQAKNSDEPS